MSESKQRDVHTSESKQTQQNYERPETIRIGPVTELTEGNNQFGIDSNNQGWVMPG